PYIHYLQRFLAFQLEAERALDTPVTLEAVPDWPQRQRASLARADLAVLGAPERRFRGSSLPPVLSTEQALGIVYVLEGSTLGGAWLLRQLAPLGVTATQGGSYLASYGSNRGKMWQRFLFMLEAAHLRRAREASIPAAAHAPVAA